MCVGDLVLKTYLKNFHRNNSSSSQSLNKIDRKIAKNSKKSALSPKSKNPRKTYPDISQKSVRNQVQKFQSPDLKVWRVPPIDKATRTDLWLGLEFVLGTNCGSQESVKSGKGSHRVKWNHSGLILHKNTLGNDEHPPILKLAVSMAERAVLFNEDTRAPFTAILDLITTVIRILWLLNMIHMSYSSFL